MQAPAVNNDVYRRLGHAWWDDDVGEFSTLRFFVNPVRFGYFKRILVQERGPTQSGLALLDVGCGGGILAEEFARAGLRVTGVDPAPESIQTAQAHAAASGLAIEYRTGSGEQLPLPNASFDMWPVATCSSTWTTWTASSAKSRVCSSRAVSSSSTRSTAPSSARSR